MAKRSAKCKYRATRVPFEDTKLRPTHQSEVAIAKDWGPVVDTVEEAADDAEKRNRRLKSKPWYVVATTNDPDDHPHELNGAERERIRKHLAAKA